LVRWLRVMPNCMSQIRRAYSSEVQQPTAPNQTA
jgi:hypothetical protein